jgi:hypothetical protein
MKNNIIEYKDLKCPPKELDCILKTLIPKYETNAIVSTAPVVSTPVTTATSGYFDVGTVRIQWGKVVSSTDDDQVITFPVAFASAPIVTSSIEISNGANFSSTTGTNQTAIKSVTTTTFIANRDNTIDAGDSPIINYFAIGQKV